MKPGELAKLREALVEIAKALSCGAFSKDDAGNLAYVALAALDSEVKS